MPAYPKVKLCRYGAAGIFWWCEGQARRLVVSRWSLAGISVARADSSGLKPARNDKG
jgi:hypothetical protein